MARQGESVLMRSHRVSGAVEGGQEGDGYLGIGRAFGAAGRCGGAGRRRLLRPVLLRLRRLCLRLLLHGRHVLHVHVLHLHLHLLLDERRRGRTHRRRRGRAHCCCAHNHRGSVSLTELFGAALDA